MSELFLRGRLTRRCTRWTPNPVPDEICFESIKSSLDAVLEGSRMVINAGEPPSHLSTLVFAEDARFIVFVDTGEFYGFNPREANLGLVARFFEKYPEYTDKAFLSVKVRSLFELLSC